MIKINNHFENIFKKLDECMTSLGKDIETLFDNINTEKKEDGTRIKIKKGSTVYLGNGTYAKLSHDVEAEIVEEPKKE